MLECLRRMTQPRCEVLLVEDDLSLRRLFVHALQKSGLTVNVAETADEAISLLKEASYDVLLLDWFLPDSHGGEVLSFIKRSRRKCARTVIVVTSADPTALSRVDRSVVKAVLFKPISPETLAAYVSGECPIPEPSE
jgi:DNA-binding response OmpR family regulator